MHSASPSASARACGSRASTLSMRALISMLRGMSRLRTAAPPRRRPAGRPPLRRARAQPAGLVFDGQRVLRQHALAQHALRQVHAPRRSGAPGLPGHGDRGGAVVQRRGHLPRLRLAALAAAGHRRGAFGHLLQRTLEHRPGLRVQRRFGKQGAQVRGQRAQGVVAADGAQHVERNDVAGAFPDRAQHRVAHAPRVAPFLDVAAAAAHFHRVGADLARVAAGAELDQRREDAHQRIGPRVARVGPAQRFRRLQHHRARLLGGQHQLEQLPAHQRHVTQPLAEGLALAGDEQRFAASRGASARRRACRSTGASC